MIMEYNNKQIKSNSISSNINYNLKFFSIKIKSNRIELIYTGI